MKTKDFYFDLPPALIAQRPSEKRGEDKLMLLDRLSGNVSHCEMRDLPNLILSGAPNGTLMVFNNSRVRKARVYGIKDMTVRPREFVFLSRVDNAGRVWNVLTKGAKKQKPGMRYAFPDGSIAEIVDSRGAASAGAAGAQNAGAETRALRFPAPLDEEWFKKYGHVPLPPYIRRRDTAEDLERYQNVYAAEPGSAACPTAGLHFTNEMLSLLAAQGIDMTWLTLHVGLGTFLPVRESEIERHKMHEEFYSVSDEAAEKINAVKKSGKKILAVGTTSLRTLESCADENGVVKAGAGSTDIFIYPGYKFKVVDALFTNFHTPESTLLMLVSAFAGRERVLNAYKIAVENEYRFFSYGDAMLIK